MNTNPVENVNSIF